MIVFKKKKRNHLSGYLFFEMNAELRKNIIIYLFVLEKPFLSVTL